MVINIKNGRTEYGKKRFFVDSGTSFISAKVITDFGIDYEKDKKFIEPESVMDKKTAYVSKGDLLFVSKSSR